MKVDGGSCVYKCYYGGEVAVISMARVHKLFSSQRSARMVEWSRCTIFIITNYF
jgi:hypothetical protein